MPLDLVNFLLQATPALLEECTLYQAGQVVTFLKQLGMKNEFLAKRVFAGDMSAPCLRPPENPGFNFIIFLLFGPSVWPDILGKDVDLDLRPIVSFLMQLGMEVTDLAGPCDWQNLDECRPSFTSDNLSRILECGSELSVSPRMQL